MMERKINVLHLLDTLRRGGKERQLIELLKNIDKNKFRAYLIVLEKRMDGYDEEAKKLTIDFKYLIRKYRWDLSLILKIRKYCINNEIDVIQVWDGMCAFYAYIVSKITGIPFINYSIQDTDPRKTYRHRIKRIILRLSQNVIGNSQEGLKVYGVEKRGRVIYNGLNTKRFENLNKENNNIFTIGIVANLTEYKDYYTFFDSIKILSTKTDKFEVHIIGWGKKAEEYKEYAEKIEINKYLKYFGRVDEVEKYIINFDVGVLCSYKDKGEGISNSVLEYMACSVLPIITDVGAAREIIENGVDGLLFEAGNSIDLAEKILYLMENPQLRIKIGEQAKKVIYNKFSYDNYINEFEKYYYKVSMNV